MSRPRLDWKDEAAVRRWLGDLRVALDDMDAVTADLLRPLRERELGTLQHRRLYRDGHRAMQDLLEYAAHAEDAPH